MTHLRRIRAGDVVVALAGACLLAALISPTLAARRFQDRIETVSSEVEVIRSAAQQVRQATGSWPSSINPAVVPAGFGGVFGDDGALVRDGYTIDWELWEVVDRVPAPSSAATLPDGADAPPPASRPPTVAVVRPLASVSVHSPSGPLLAALTERFGAEQSFVRDSTWMLIVDLVPGSP